MHFEFFNEDENEIQPTRKHVRTNFVIQDSTAGQQHEMNPSELIEDQARLVLRGQVDTETPLVKFSSAIDDFLDNKPFADVQILLHPFIEAQEYVRNDGTIGEQECFEEEKKRLPQDVLGGLVLEWTLSQ